MNIQKSEIILLSISTLVTVALALLVIRWLQPSLLGISSDLILVKSSEEVVPYYENIFRKEDLSSSEFLLSDPIIKTRARQLYPDLVPMGPNDLLGFRNEAVPNNADIIIIGDSQTYGNNAMMQDNWPHYFAENLPAGISVYSMATGGWGAVQYFYAMAKAPVFKPRLVIVAFYTGNDSLDTFSMVYGSDTWHEFIPDPGLDKLDAPEIRESLPSNELLPITFSDGVKTVFTPTLRHVANKKHPAVDAGYQAMVIIARKMAAIAHKENIQLVFTLIPTKELVYSRKIENEQIKVGPAYQTFIRDEQMRITEFSSALKAIDGTVYIDVITALQEQALTSVVLYHNSNNGHPVRDGYRVIGSSIAQSIAPLFQPLPGGFYISMSLNKIQTALLFIEDGNYWIVDDPENLAKEMSIENLVRLKSRELAGLSFKGHKKTNEIDVSNQQ